MLSRQMNFVFCWLLYITLVESKKSTTQKPDLKVCIPAEKKKQSLQGSLELNVDFINCNFADHPLDSNLYFFSINGHVVTYLF